MKKRKHRTLIAVGLALGAFAIAAPPAAQPKTNSAPVAVSDEHLIMRASVATKRYCVAMRKGNQSTLRELTDPDYLKQHRIGKDDLVNIKVAPVLGIYDLPLGEDRSTVLCLYETEEGEKEAMVLKIRYDQEDDEVYIVPPNPPSPKDGTITPWILHKSLERFINS